MPGKLILSPNQKLPYFSCEFSAVKQMLQQGSPLHVLPIAPLFQVAVVEAVVVLFKLLANSLIFLANHTWTQSQKKEKPLLSPESMQTLQWLEGTPAPAPTPIIPTTNHSRASSVDSLNPGASLGEEFEIIPSEGDSCPGEEEGIVVPHPDPEEVRSIGSDENSIGSDLPVEIALAEAQHINSPGLFSNPESWDDLASLSDDSQTAESESVNMIEDYQQKRESPR